MRKLLIQVSFPVSCICSVRVRDMNAAHALHMVDSEMILIRSMFSQPHTTTAGTCAQINWNTQQFHTNFDTIPDLHIGPVFLPFLALLGAWSETAGTCFSWVHSVYRYFHRATRSRRRRVSDRGGIGDLSSSTNSPLLWRTYLGSMHRYFVFIIRFCTSPVILRNSIEINEWAVQWYVSVQVTSDFFSTLACWTASGVSRAT